MLLCSWPEAVCTARCCQRRYKTVLALCEFGFMYSPLVRLPLDSNYEMSHSCFPQEAMTHFVESLTNRAYKEANSQQTRTCSSSAQGWQHDSLWKRWAEVDLGHVTI